MTKATPLSLFTPLHDVPPAVDPLLVTILSWPRPHGTPAELMFRHWLTEQLGGVVQKLGAGTLFVRVPRLDGGVGETLFSCHIDTCDSQLSGAMTTIDDQSTHLTKLLTYDPNFGLIGLDKEGKVGSCLGADDGVGVWLMLKMIEAKVPGGYIFHTGEECGGIGSAATARDHAALLKTFEIAIAFDRPHNDEVITHQRGGTECASQKCALALCARLNKHGFNYAPSDKGSFTDTANYRKLIPECFNLGVGYDSQHGYSETLDYAHAFALLDALCHIDWDALPVDRDPSLPDPAKWAAPVFGAWARDDVPSKVKTYTPTFGKPPAYTPPVSAFDDTMLGSRLDIICMCEEDPETMADTVQDLLLEVAQLRAQIAVLTQFNRREM